MDERGFAYTLDAVLALIPVIIVLFGITNLAASHETPNHIYSSQKAQDTMDFMAQYREGGRMSVLETMSNTLESGKNSKESIHYAGETAATILDKNFPNMEYLLTEENQLGGQILAGELDIGKANNVATASRNCGNYTYRIYVR